jgi:hypothetical protein
MKIPEHLLNEIYHEIENMSHGKASITICKRDGHYHFETDIHKSIFPEETNIVPFGTVPALHKRGQKAAAATFRSV